MKIRSKNRFSDTLIVSTGARSMELTVDVDLNTLATSMRKAKEVLAQAQIAAKSCPHKGETAEKPAFCSSAITCVKGRSYSISREKPSFGCIHGLLTGYVPARGTYQFVYSTILICAAFFFFFSSIRSKLWIQSAHRK